MLQRRILTDLDECERLWKALIRARNISDLWEFRMCFHRHFRCSPHFLILEDRRGIAGMMPLSYSRDTDRYLFFPGETWKDKTWIERTPVFLRDPEILPELLLSCPEGTYLRYMEIPEPFPLRGLELDEIGYVLYPPSLNFSMDLYAKRFSSKKFKGILKTVRTLTEDRSLFHLNRLEDFDLLVEMSLRYFGQSSYLCDRRFRESFRDVTDLLHRRGRLRMVSLDIDGRTAAVDVGASFGGIYTVFLGGTDREIQGVAKAMNMHHLTYACQEGFSKVDFLCGDFHWKKLWHLDPEPLYRYVWPAVEAEEELEEAFSGDSLDSAGPAQPWAQFEGW